MEPSSTRIQELFTRYLQRRCTPAEVEELTRLLQQADAAAMLEKPMKALWEEMRDNPVEHPVDWEKMYGRVSRIHPFRRPLYQAAAVLLGLVLLSAAYWSISSRQTGHAPVASGEIRTGLPVAGTLSAGALSSGTVSAGTMPAGSSPAEKQQVVHLPDGSTVILNKNSKLDYSTSFTGSAREVSLSGEAYFDITHRPGHPFLVRTGKVTTRVLGTEFNVKAYPGEASIEVTVRHGKVQVVEENKQMGLLTDDQQIRFDKGTESYVRKKIDIGTVIAWKPHEIRFDDIRMEEAAREIGQKFGVTVRFVNPVLKDCRVTATFYENDALEEIMAVICAVSQSNFTIKDHVITIDGKGCN